MLDYQKIADIYVDNSEEMENFVKTCQTISYPQKTQAMWQEFAGLTFTGDTPNHILGLAYAKAVARTGIQLGPVQRQGQVFIRKRWKRPTPRRRLSERVLTSWTWCVTFTVCQSFEEVTKVSWRNYFPCSATRLRPTEISVRSFR